MVPLFDVCVLSCFWCFGLFCMEESHEKLVKWGKMHNTKLFILLCIMVCVKEQWRVPHNNFQKTFYNGWTRILHSEENKPLGTLSFKCYCSSNWQNNLPPQSIIFERLCGVIPLNFGLIFFPTLVIHRNRKCWHSCYWLFLLISWEFHMTFPLHLL